MMYCKALYFSDFHTATQIMVTNSLKKQKQLGKQVRDFDHDALMEIVSKTAEEGNYVKFTQSHRLKTGLLRTEERLLCEAALRDDVWRIGYNENAAGAVVEGWEDSDMGSETVGEGVDGC
jgi:ribA/ribD-fused uncharacterized protein